jgi:hypothetical protein
MRDEAVRVCSFTARVAIDREALQLRRVRRLLRPNAGLVLLDDLEDLNGRGGQTLMRWVGAFCSEGIQVAAACRRPLRDLSWIAALAESCRHSLIANMCHSSTAWLVT